MLFDTIVVKPTESALELVKAQNFLTMAAIANQSAVLYHPTGDKLFYTLEDENGQFQDIEVTDPLEKVFADTELLMFNDVRIEKDTELQHPYVPLHYLNVNVDELRRFVDKKFLDEALRDDENGITAVNVNTAHALFDALNAGQMQKVTGGATKTSYLVVTDTGKWRRNSVFTLGERHPLLGYKLVYTNPQTASKTKYLRQTQLDKLMAKGHITPASSAAEMAREELSENLTQAIVDGKYYF